jgi:transcriptional regulator with XRE-family HTH domain
MDTLIARQIAIRMKAKNLSIPHLEKEANLTTHAVRNILRGKSKRPSGELLQAIADALGCTVRDLLTDEQRIFEENDPAESQEGLLDSPCKQKLMAETFKTVQRKIAEKKWELTTRQVLSSIQEIYLHSLEKDPEKVDHAFADWFIGLVGEI